jgi:hypothetical protein
VESKTPSPRDGTGGGVTTALSPFDATVELIAQVWRETVATLTENQFDRSSWSEVEAVLVSGASTPLILPPRSDLPHVSPSFSTSRDSSHAALSRLLTLIRSSAAREALDPTPFNLFQLFLARPSEAALQLCQYIGPLAAVCATTLLCTGAWLSLLAGLLGCASHPICILILIRVIYSLTSQLFGPQSDLMFLLGAFNVIETAGGESSQNSGTVPCHCLHDVCRGPTCGAQKPKQGQDAGTRRCHKVERECCCKTTATVESSNPPEAEIEVSPERETAEAPTPAPGEPGTKVASGDHGTAVKCPCHASVYDDKVGRGVATPSPSLITGAGVNHRVDQGISGYSGWLETCSLAPFQSVLAFCVNLLSVIRDPISHAHHYHDTTLCQKAHNSTGPPCCEGGGARISMPLW